LCHALNTKGGVHSEFTIMKEAENCFYLVSAGAFQRLDHDWILKWMPKDGSVQFENLTNSMGVLVVSGPKARELMQRVSKDDFSNENFKWLSSKQVDIGYAPCTAMRVNFVGELGWELHHQIEYQNHIFDKLMEAGKDLGLKPYGIRAMNSLRVEKSYKLVGTELSIEYSPYESGLDRFIHPNKGKFIGLEALNKWREKGFNNKLVTLEVHNVTDADVLGNNPIYDKDKVVGRATGGDFGFRLNKSIALGMVKPEVATTGQKLKIDILGKMYDATILDESPYDPKNDLLKA
jgi:Glycine cleavage system T protein (aminomethyltransferase)